MFDETKRLKAEEQGHVQPQSSPAQPQSNNQDWSWIETKTYEPIFVDSLKEAESNIMVVTQEETERRHSPQPSEWGWQHLALIIAGLIGFSIFTGPNIIAILATYWWLIFIVWAWRNTGFKLSSWPAFVIGIFSWIIMTSQHNGFNLSPLIAFGIISTGLAIIRYLHVHRTR